MSVIDLSQDPPRVIHYETVGDGPEGLAISPNGDFAAVAIQNGGSVKPDAFFFSKIGHVDLLRIDGKKVTKVGSADVGQFPEGVAISPDGKYVYSAGNLTSDLSVLKVDGDKLTQVGDRIMMPGDKPASMAVSPK